MDKDKKDIEKEMEEMTRIQDGLINPSTTEFDDLSIGDGLIIHTTEEEEDDDDDKENNDITILKEDDE